MSLHDFVTQGLLNYTPLRHRATRKRFVHARRRAFEAVRSTRYSRPGHDGIDAKLERHLPSTGVFVEAGANDGYTWSNTYFLERFRNWHGVLIEGIPALSEECRRLRSRSTVYNCALVGPDYAEPYVTMTYSDLRSLITGSEQQMEQQALAATAAPYKVRVLARTLDDVLQDAGVKCVDFISLDLEGLEAPALRGLDFERHSPTWLLVEIAAGGGRQAVEAVLGSDYEAVEELTPGDVLYHRRGRP
jgi:FkbM family methyltransferase